LGASFSFQESEMSGNRGLYDAFNARNLSPEQVAETFVSNEDFEALWRNTHVILMGPRGSGKTTLMKMLTPRGLNSWKAKIASDVRESINYTAAYVPTDIHWHHQLFYSAKQLSNLPNLSRVSSEVSVTTNILLAICDAVQDQLMYLNPPECTKIEGKISRIMLKEWLLPPTVPSFNFVRESLYSRINEIRRTIHRAIVSRAEDSLVKQLPEFYFLDYMAAVAPVCLSFDQSINKEKIKWALCFDELELAPEWLQNKLFSEVRSTDERFLFKLSTSPLPRYRGQTNATAKDDFKLIRLWPHAEKDRRDFCETLAQETVSRKFGDQTSPVEIFGHSTVGAEAENEYEAGSTTYQVIQSVAGQEKELVKILLRHGIDPENPTTTDTYKRDQVLRKVKPIAYHRQAFKKFTEGIEVRSRKLVSLYHGIEDIYDMSEGNPRWLIGLLNDLCDPIVASGRRTISKEAQARVLTRASKQFASLIQALPEALISVGNRKVHLSQILGNIGRFFFKRQVIDDFSLDPPGSFLVDNDVSLEIVNVLRLAAYHGAIVYLGPQSFSLDTDLYNKRFRLSYMLAPQTKLPLRLYSEVNLSRCLKLGPARPRRDLPQLPLG
jgi:hypothetical protein